MKVCILGNGGHARVIGALLDNLGREHIYLDKEQEDTFDVNGCDLALGVGMPSILPNVGLRYRVMITSKFQNKWFPILTDATAIVETMMVGEGAQILAGSIVQTGTIIDAFAIINTGAIVEHDCRIGRGAHIAPGAILGGGVTVGDYSLVGLGARVLPELTIGSDAIVAAGAVVIADVPDGATVKGVPAR